ncbi:unnamed protein product [Euphydryas editha]|uniref:Endonuclease-reverse transcriptase n=1 Tax=Euphydryas editha TaxID=104508 RepID=A0AAU9UNQ4_EUPED|nr:unnamed protein product [Euphydryas editha]
MTSSDHNGICFQIGLKRLGNTGLDHSITIADINEIQNINEIDDTIAKLHNIIETACRKSIPRTKDTNRLSLPWWSEGLAVLKRKVATRKRRIRCAAPLRHEKVVGEYLEVKNKYEIEAKIAQVSSWKAFCGKQNREGMWKGIYSVIGRTVKKEDEPPLVVNDMELDAKSSARLMA